ncbi:MAG TPA: hypothetical protein DCY18_09295 [Thauera sp.]|nr:hypothetical protein [Thauera sp.]
MATPTISRPIWVGDKSAVLVRALAACSGAENDATGALLDRILNEIATTRPAGLLLAEALRVQANALHHLADAAMAPITDDAFAVLLDEHHRLFECPLRTAEGAEPAMQQDALDFEDWANTAPLSELIAFAEAEMQGEALRYDDHSLAAALCQFDQEGRLAGVVRLFAARLIAEILARFDEYASAEAFVEALRTQAK